MLYSTSIFNISNCEQDYWVLYTRTKDVRRCIRLPESCREPRVEERKSRRYARAGKRLCPDLSLQKETTGRLEKGNHGIRGITGHTPLYDQAKETCPTHLAVRALTIILWNDCSKPET